MRGSLLYCGDCIQMLQLLKSQDMQAELIITSPPYNIGKEYEEITSLDRYLENQKRVISTSLDVLSPTGSICWQTGHFIDGAGKDKEAYPLDLLLYPIFKSFDLKLRNRIVWHFGHGLHERVRFSGRHETILWLTRNTDNYTFNLDPIRVPQKYPGKRHFKGTKKGQLSGNPRGKNPGDVWDIPNVKSNHIEKTDHPCQFPVALAERLILALTNPGDLVIDPYIGSGTAAIAALKHNRRVAGSDTNQSYLTIATHRLKAFNAGTLRTRELNKPVYEPNPQSTLAQPPKEWTTVL